MNVAAFEKYILHEKRYSLHTVTAYLKDLAQFSEFLIKQYGLSALHSVKRDHIRSWVVELVNEKLTPRTINRKISTLKTFYRMLLMEGKVAANPASSVTLPKIRKKLPVFVEREKTESLFSADHFSNDFEGQRDRLVLELLYTTGMRLSELITIKNTDINYHKQEVRVLGKRNKERIIPLMSKTIEQIEVYKGLKLVAFESGKSATLLVTNKGQNLYPKFVYRLVNNYLSQVTTQTKKSPHVLRHTFATHMLNNGAELNAIKEILGHVSLAATQVYTHNNIDQLKAIHEQAHPKG